MRFPAGFVLTLVTAFGLAAPAYAASNAPIPEPGMLGLLSLAVAGVVIGRRLSSKPPSDE